MQKVLETNCCLCKCRFCLFIFEMWLLCLVWCSIIFNIYTLEAEVGGLGEFLANLELADISCTV